MKAVKVMLVALSMVIVCNVAGAETFRFTASVDNRPYDAANKARWEWLLHEMTANVGDEGVFHIMPGDIDPPGVTDASLKTQFGDDVIWYPVVGNHEAETAEDMTWIRNVSPLPYVVKEGPSGCETTTYSFDYGNAHFVAINEYYNGTSDTGTDGDVVDALYNWLVADLAANTKPAVFLIGHEPAYPEYAHEVDSLNKYPANRDRFWKLLNDEQVIAYLCGHTHWYYAKQVDGDDWEPFTWQIDCGNAGNPREAEQTFVDVTVTDTDVIFTAWQGTEGVSFTVTESWTVEIPFLAASNPSPTDGATSVLPASVALSATVENPSGTANLVNVDFFGREKPTFSIVVLPDTQNYVNLLDAGTPEIFTSQTQWIADNAATMNIVFVTHEGDITDNTDRPTEGDVPAEWARANTSMSLLDGVVPYGLLPGNHDYPTTYYNQYFPFTRYGESWYGGHYGTTNDNSYQLFSAGGDNYIILHIEYNPGSTMADPVIAWADGVLKANVDRIAIITTHAYLDANGNRISEGTGIWDVLVQGNDNVYFVLCGHVSAEAMRTDLVGDREVHQLLANYQSRANGGDGWLRIMTFEPDADEVHVQTYSPWLDDSETDTNSDFVLAFDMTSIGYSFIGSNSSVADGGIASVAWTDLSMETGYEWYVTVTDIVPDPDLTVPGPDWSFTTASLKAGNPDPANGATDVDVDADLSWSAGIDAVTHDVYFGTDAGNLTRVSTLQEGTTYEPGTLAQGVTYYWAIDEFDISDNLLAAGDLWSFTTVSPGPVVIVAAGSTWKYDDTNTDFYSAGWPSVDDASWPTGAAPLGFGTLNTGEVGINTTLTMGSPRYPCYYFRHSFTVTSAYDSLTVKVLRDDGCVVYLNGTELVDARSNMPASEITHTTLSVGTAGGADETTYFETSVNPALLTIGTNVLAVDVHQCNTTSSDIGFDLELEGVIAADPQSARNPDPANGATDVDVDADLSWSAGIDAVSHDVYFGTDPGSLIPVSMQQTGTTYDPGTLQEGVTYYWAIDEHDSGEGVTPGDVWSFTTAVPPPLTFQQGVDGYTGMVDTMIRSADPGTIFADSATQYDGSYQYQYNADTSSGVPAGPSQVLMRFDGIIGTNPAQIPLGSLIVSATLRIRSTDDGDGGKLHLMLQQWVDTLVTWNNSFGANGIQADNSEALIVEDDGVLSNSPNTDVDLDVTTTLQDWADGAAVNNGWAIVPNGTNGWHMAAAEHPTLDYRPELIVTFTTTGNRPPTVSITSPSDGATFSEGDNITIDADASDSDGTVTKVEFYQDGIKLGEDTTAPYSYPWNNVSAGSYSLTAKATDDESLATTSAPVNVTINPPNRAPVANDDSDTTDEDTPVTIDVLANDTDPDSDPLVVDSVTQPTNGTAVNNGTDVTYTPNANFSGIDTFTYIATDGALTDTATVTIDVTAVDYDAYATVEPIVTIGGTPVGAVDATTAADGVYQTIDEAPDGPAAYSLRVEYVLHTQVNPSDVSEPVAINLVHTWTGGTTDAILIELLVAGTWTNVTADIGDGQCQAAATDIIDAEGNIRIRFADTLNKKKEDRDTLAVDLLYADIVAGPPAPDTQPPTPSTMTWATVPYSTGQTSIAMVATTASDSSGVEYYFTCTAGGGSDSGWQDSTSYVDTGLSSGTQYTYTVTARDKSANQNQTGASTAESATTDSPDLTPPTPATMTWATVPYSTGESSIAMVATTASDSSGVEYKFVCTVGGGHDSVWQDSPSYEDTGLSSGTQYTYTVTARDKSAAQNETAASTAESATTASPDLTPPTPATMTWATPPYSTGETSIAMVATTASDPSGVEYYFTCTAGGGNDSGWQDSPSYTDTGLAPDTQYTYTVTARDKSSNQNTTATSTAASATTDAEVGDVVTITKAEYKAARSELNVEATSNDGGVAILTVEGYGTMTYDSRKNTYKLKIRPVPDPGGTVTVTSSLGGSATRAVTYK